MYKRPVFFTTSLLLSLSCLHQAWANPASPQIVPPSTATIPASSSAISSQKLENEFVALNVLVAGKNLAEVLFQDKINGREYSFGPDIFSLSLDKGDKDNLKKIPARELLAGAPKVEELKAQPEARRLVERRAGKKITIPFAAGNDGLKLDWIAEIREGTPYVRVSVVVTAEQGPQPVREITVLDIAAPEAIVQGSVKGAPVTAAGGRLFAGVENPLSVNVAENGRFQTKLVRKLDVPSRSPFKVSAVLGASNPGQLRRTFQQSYINEERARPYAPFLNYNTWYDIGYFDPYNEKQAMEVVKLYGEELVKKRGAVIDSFMFDDGWDNTETLWQFHKGLPNEFKKVSKEADSFGAGPGVWFSPWGGYGQPKENRLKAAGDKYETNESGFALAGPKYYKLFKDMCVRMIKENGINHFKLDGTSGTETQIPGSKFSSDFEAIIQLINELRDVRSDLYINLTTGTWASPFWFGIADSIWRGGYDHEFVGEGSKRNQWMTFRDARIYDNNVAISPLFPINSLMTHGVIYTKRARGLETVEGADLVNEIWSGFGSGTQMQEIYVSPGLLTQSEWDVMADAAKWARANKNTLIDTHWVGGSPSELKVYGWAAWSPEKGIVTLRNPSAQAQDWSFDVASVFELPVGAATKYTLVSPKGDKLPEGTLEAGKPVTLRLEPFQVIVLEALPVQEATKTPAPKL